MESPDYRETIANEHVIGNVAQALSDKCDWIYQNLMHQQDVYEGHITCKDKTDSDDVKDLTWSLSNLCRGGFKTSEHWEQYLLAFSAFSNTIFFNNQDVWTESW